MNSALAYLRELGDDGVLGELATLFRSSVVARMPDLHDALELRDWVSAASLAHEFKGAGANLGMASLTARFVELEEGIRLEEDGCEPAFAAAQLEMHRSLHELDAAVAEADTD